MPEADPRLIFFYALQPIGEEVTPCCFAVFRRNYNYKHWVMFRGQLWANRQCS
ncbi:hypothetical protein SERLADRAFT_374890 [Serpula lacrymans var. lacrymans S7.9]|uniref:Uncharacterized protein n=1 Tax=Serpula lacrymans var. lacrymans (strain S7.9) TaxID=578457 RepID=F8PDJ6_SERL9|nr:uncharacterized protein SERLADRAFT_374890 [Serpula lacrymans var. lacrymans S7.9]EGO18817.1 hypothetical protein SERLADRAFT_374890 [Serpula lacrymans var. lacrymans S7.9]